MAVWVEKDFEGFTCERQRTPIIVNHSGVALVIALPLFSLPLSSTLEESLHDTCINCTVFELCIPLVDGVNLVDIYSAMWGLGSVSL